ncbi:amino acid permease/ SLC12A domain-containing protein [Chytriomyces cf. hyalinus JEL632]|nr:amino acid permease/ SLC12A domain-containing protein [Chytriomyces cf. hyalinus JEL632]
MSKDTKDPTVLHTAPEGGQLQRKLQARHLEMIAIGGTIGTGLLLRSGGAIAKSGPIGALICFAIVGLQVFGVASGIGEMATLLPVEGAFSAMPTRFVNKAMGFFNGWNYWLLWALTFPAEMSAIAVLMAFWFPDVKSWIWSFVYIIPFVGVNLIAVTGFAEVEFVLCIVKIIAIVLFIIVGTLYWFGVGHSGGFLGFRNWSPAIVGTDGLDSFLRIGGTFTTAFFSYGGTELVGLTAGEAANPRKSVPRAINGTFWRIIIFYIGAIFVVGLILPPDSPILTQKSASMSPFVYAYKAVGISFASHMMNFVIIVAASSAANSSLYACSRTLMRLAEEGSAPSMFARVNAKGIPVNSVMAVTVISVISVAGAYIADLADGKGSAKVFDWLSGVISYGIMVNWMAMSFTHLRFRHGYVAQGRKIEDLPYIAPFFPYADYVALTIGAFVTAFIFVSAFYNSTNDPEFYNTQWFLDNSWIYFTIPLLIACYVVKAATSPNGFGFIPYDQMDFETGKLIETAEEIAENEALKQKPRNGQEWAKRIWFKLF